MGHAGHHFIMHGIMRARPPPILHVEDYARASCAGRILCPNAMCGVMPVSPAPIYHARYYARASGAGQILCAASFEPGVVLMK